LHTLKPRTFERHHALPQTHATNYSNAGNEGELCVAAPPRDTQPNG
jgi:hypothetical protein